MPIRREKIPKEAEAAGKRTGDRQEAVAFIAETLIQLMTICESHRLDTLGYLLGMAHLEASETGRRLRRGGR